MWEPAKKPLFVHHQLAIPKKSKINFILNERKRIKDRRSTEILTTKHQNTFDDILCLNGYPENNNRYLTIIAGARMGSESIAHEDDGRMGAFDSETMRARREE